MGGDSEIIKNVRGRAIDHTENFPTYQKFHMSSYGLLRFGTARQLESKARRHFRMIARLFLV
jgi:hypothetical protein